VIASGGVSSITDLLSLLALEPLGVTGVIVGPLHWRFPQRCTPSDWSGRLQDIPPDLGFSAFA